jgi:integrase
VRVKKRVKKLRLSYGVHISAAIAFIEKDKSAKRFLAGYHDRTYEEYARAFCLFFNWLKQKKGINLTPTQFLNEQLERSKGNTVEDRSWAANLAIDFCRDNPDFKGLSNSHANLHWNVIDQFFKTNLVPFCGTRNPLRTKAGRRKYKPKPLAREDAKRILAALSPRERAIAFSMLQSGMACKECLDSFNFMLPYVQEQIKAGAERIRIDFDERKGNGFSYFTFIGNDGVQQLRLWLNERENWIKEHKFKLSPEAQNAIFITRTGEPMTEAKFQRNFTCQLYRKGIKKEPFEVVTHQLRKIFKTEASPPERNINGGIVEFMMGHVRGLEAVGGTYDQSPQIYQKMIEKEYQKLEPFLNLFSESIEQPGESEALKQIEQLQARIEKMEQQTTLAYVYNILSDKKNSEKLLRSLLPQKLQKEIKETEQSIEAENP